MTLELTALSYFPIYLDFESLVISSQKYLSPSPEIVLQFPGIENGENLPGLWEQETVPFLNSVGLLQILEGFILDFLFQTG